MIAALAVWWIKVLLIVREREYMDLNVYSKHKEEEVYREQQRRVNTSTRVLTACNLQAGEALW